MDAPDPSASSAPFRLYANSCDARSIIAAMNAGSGVAGLTAVIAGIFGALPLTVVAGIAAALLQFGQAAVNYCSRRGRGMVMQNVYWPPCYNQ